MMPSNSGHGEKQLETMSKATPHKARKRKEHMEDIKISY
jgi:hypothetical protein